MARTSSTSGVRLEKGSGSSAHPRHRRRRVHQRISLPELLEAGHEVIGLDDFSKYGRLAKSYDTHPCYRFVEGDAKDVALLTDLAAIAIRSWPRRR